MKYNLSYHNLLAFLGALVLFGSGCRKDESYFTKAEPTLSDLELLLDAVANTGITSTFSLNKPQQDTILITNNGVRIFLTDMDELFKNKDGAIVAASTCSDLKIDVTILTDKSDIMAKGITTATTSGDPFESGGVVRLRVFCGGEPLEILDNRTIKIQIPNPGPQPGFIVFQGAVPTGSIAPVWEKTSQPVYVADWTSNTQPTSTIAGYELLLDQAGWFAAGRLFSEPTTSFCVQLPLAYSPEYTRSFLVFSGLNVVIELKAGQDFGRFCAENIPTGGYPVQVVSVSKLGDQYWLGHKNSETSGQPSSESKVDLTPLSSDFTNIVDFLKGF